jgi:hypothetical protein
MRGVDALEPDQEGRGDRGRRSYPPRHPRSQAVCADAPGRGVRAPASGAPEGSLTAGGDPVEVLRGALQATKANGQPDWQIRLSAARTLAALPPRSPSPNRSPSPRLSSTTSRRGAARSLHCAPPALFRLATTSELPAEPLPESGLYVFQGEKGLMIPLVRHGADDGDQVHILSSREAAADILRAFGGDPHFLDTISADPQPNTNTP